MPKFRVEYIPKMEVRSSAYPDFSLRLPPSALAGFRGLPWNTISACTVEMHPTIYAGVAMGAKVPDPISPEFKVRIDAYPTLMFCQIPFAPSGFHLYMYRWCSDKNARGLGRRVPMYQICIYI